MGGNDTFPLDVRVISTSGISLSKFWWRGEMYFFLNVLDIVAPPLRKRKEDIPKLVKSLIGHLNRQLGMMAQGMDDRGMEFFQSSEKRMVLEMMTTNNGNRTKTAKALGISWVVFWRKLDKYGSFVVMDAAYKMPWIAKKALEDKKIPVLPYTRYTGKQEWYKPWEYAYAPV